MELWAVSNQCRTYANGNGSFAAIQLKPADAPIDTVALVNAVSGWFYRTVMFQQRANEQSHMNESCGSSEPVNLGSEQVREIAGNGPAYLIANVWNREKAIQKARAVLADMDRE